MHGLHVIMYVYRWSVWEESPLMCMAWACTPLAMGIGMGAGASSVSIVIPSRANASCRKGVVGAPELMFLDSLPLVSRHINVMCEGRI